MKMCLMCFLIFLTSAGYQHAKTVELQQRSSSVATQQTTVSSVPSQPSTTGVSDTHTHTHFTHTAQASMESLRGNITNPDNLSSVDVQLLNLSPRCGDVQVHFRTLWHHCQGFVTGATTPLTEEVTPPFSVAYQGCFINVFFLSFGPFCGFSQKYLLVGRR